MKACKDAKVIKVLIAAMLGIGGAANSPAQAGEWQITGVVEGVVKLEKEGETIPPGGLQNVDSNNEPSVFWTFSSGSVENGQLSRISAAHEIDGRVRVILQ